MKFKDTAKSFNWLGDLALCQGSTFETCTWVPSTKGYFESNLLVSANDCTRWFTDHHYEYTAHGTGACYATGSTTHRCFSVGICNPTEGTRPNVKMYKLAWATKRWVVEWVGLGLLIVTTARICSFLTPYRAQQSSGVATYRLDITTVGGPDDNR